MAFGRNLQIIFDIGDFGWHKAVYPERNYAKKRDE